MNFSTACKSTSTNAKRRQSKFTLAFFCFVIIAVLATSCSENIFETPYGNRTLVLDTLTYDQSIITGVKNLNVSAKGNSLIQNKVGQYNDLYTEFLIKFTNFESLSGLPDSVVATINSANVVLYVADYWGSEANISLDISMLANDTSLYWENISAVDETFEKLEGNTVYYNTYSVPTDADSVYLPLDLTLIDDWYTKRDSFYVNNGFTVKKSDLSDGLIAFHTLEYSSTSNDLRPRLRLECSLSDTNDVYLKDSTFFVYSSGDMQYTESSSIIPDSLFYLSQGNIHRAFLEMDNIRQDTLLGPTDLLNKADLHLVMDELSTNINIEDTLIYLTARLFKTDYWEDDSIEYMYTAISNIIDDPSDTIKIDISQLVQYLISNPKDNQYEGLFFYLNNEYNGFNILSIDPDKTELDIVYTKVNNE